MSWKQQFAKLRGLVGRRQHDKELDEEIRAHLEMEEQENRAKGMSPEEAHYAAMRKFGNVVRTEERAREMWRWVWLETLAQDVRFGLRMLAKNPGFTAVAVLTLALGIGGTTAIFSVVYGTTLNPWPYKDGDRLTIVVSYDPKQGPNASRTRVSPAEFLYYRQHNQVFDEVYGEASEGLLLSRNGIPELLRGTRVTGNTFHVLGVAPLIGRPLGPEDSNPGAPPVAVLCYRTWKSKFGGDPGIVGHTLILNHEPATVVGVMPPRFEWCGEVCLPADLSAPTVAGQELRFYVEGRLKPGVTVEQASADIGILGKQLAALYPKDHPKDAAFGVKSMTDEFTRVFRKTLYILFGAVGLLLLIACVNVANLLLARATTREREIAVRAALGASRGRLVRQFLIESLILTAAGASLGCLFARIALGPLLTILPPWMVPPEAEIRVNGSVLLFALGSSLVCTLLFGLGPALLAASRDPQELLRAGGRGVGESPGHNRLRNLLVVSEVALSLILLTGAGMLVRGFWHLRHIQLGYDVDNLLDVVPVFTESRYKTFGQQNQFRAEMLRRLRALPGVTSAAIGWPGLHFASSAPIEVVGQSSTEDQSVWFRLVGDGYFETLRIPLLSGRVISREDLAQARPVVMVNRAFATRYFTGMNPIGQQVRWKDQLWFPLMKQSVFEVIGVVGDTAHDDGDGPRTKPQIFLPATLTGIPWNLFFVRTAGDPARLLNPIRQEFAAIEKELPVEGGEVKAKQQDWYAEPRFVVTMLVAFGSLGLTLVSVGVYSVLSYAVSRRTQEIGIRMALGAQATDMRRMVMRAGLKWLGIGIAIGVPASIALAKILQNRIWGIKSADPLTLLAVSLILTAVGLAACYIPARRATKVDPMVALRYE